MFYYSAFTISENIELQILTNKEMKAITSAFENFEQLYYNCENSYTIIFYNKNKHTILQYKIK